MKFWAVGSREDRDRMLSLKGSPHLISPICCPDPAEKWLLVLVSTSDPAKIPHASAVTFSNVSATGSLPQLYCCSLQQMSFLWWGLGKGRSEERVGGIIWVQPGAGQGSNPVAWLTFPWAWGHFCPSCCLWLWCYLHPFLLGGEDQFATVVLNGTWNSSLKVMTKELSNLSLPFQRSKCSSARIDLYQFLFQFLLLSGSSSRLSSRCVLSGLSRVDVVVALKMGQMFFQLRRNPALEGAWSGLGLPKH